MAVTDDIQELTMRVSRLEKASIENTETITWLAGTLGTMKAVQDNHTQRLDRVETKVDRVEIRLDRVEGKVDRVDKTLNDMMVALPKLVADAMRDVLKEKR